MILTDIDIINFQNLYKKELGIEISKEEAYEKGVKLLHLLSLVYKPMSSEDYSVVQKHRKNTLPHLVGRIT